MRYSDESYNLRVELDTKQLELSPDDARRLQASLPPLGKLVEDLPVSDLYITIFHHPRGDPEYQVKPALVLPAKTLFSSDTDASFHPAFGRCVANLAVPQPDHSRADICLYPAATAEYHQSNPAV
jgi:hypothetical protein